jgi:VanZ family protein
MLTEKKSIIKKYKSLIKTILFAVLTVFWTSIIFSFSMKPAYKSNEQSNNLLEKVIIIIKNLTTITINPIPLTNLFRKFAHFTEFFILGVIAYLFLKYLKHWHLKNPSKKNQLYSTLEKATTQFVILYGAFIAIIDETLQYFTGAGRAMRFTDVLIDTMGVIAFLIILWIFRKFFRKFGSF